MQSLTYIYTSDMLIEEVYVRRAFGGSVTIFVFALLLLATAASAAVPIASVTSTAPFYLNGAYVRVEGVPSWPVVAGDTIQTLEAPATILFKDGSRITVAAGSKTRIEENKGGTGVRLEDGTMQILQAPQSSLFFFLKNEAVSTTPGVEAVASTKPGSGLKPHPLLLGPPPPPPPSPLSTR
jgi:hypothetical protein